MTTDVALQDPLGLPGITRDQTPFQSKTYVDGSGTRFYNNQPRKIGGYLACSFGNPEIVRGMFGAITGQEIGFETGVNAVNLYAGRESSLSYFLLNNDGQSGTTIDVTPTDFVASPFNMWLFDQYSLRTNETNLNVVRYILALVTPANTDIGTEQPGALYVGLNGETAPFVNINSFNIEETLNVDLNGFVCVANPYIFVGGQQGILIWNDVNAASSINDLFTFPTSNFLFASDTRLVVGKAVRGGNAIAILVWSLTGLYRITESGNPDLAFTREILSEEISIVSQNCVVEVSQISSYFWIGQDCFFQYNGVVSELLNPYNKQWFFSNINKNSKEKCWSYVNSSYNEVWFFAPFGEATECTNAVVHNYLGKFWYDTISARSCGISSGFLSYPIQADSKGTETYNIWMHEYGTDMQINGVKFAIKAYIRTHDRILATYSPTLDLQTRTRRLEADMFLNGQMNLQIYTKQFPSSPYEVSRVYLLRDPVTGLVGKTDIVNMGRIVSYYFESNEVGGYFQFGTTIVDIAPDGSERPSR